MASAQTQPAANTHVAADASRLELLYRVAEEVNSTLELRDCLDRIVDGAYTVFRAEKVSLMLADEETNELRIWAARNVPEDVIAKTRIQPGEGLAGKVALSGETLVVSDTEDDPRLQRKNKRQYRTGSFAIVPLKHKDDVLGVVNLTNRSDGSAFSQEDLALLQALAHQAAVAIQNSRLIGELNAEKEQLRRRAFESDILCRVSSSLRYGLGYQHLIELLTESLDQLLDYDVLCSLLLVDGDEDFDVHARNDVPPEMVAGLQRRLLDALSAYPRGEAVRLRTEALAAELGPQAPDEARPASVIGVPLEVGGQAMGMICVAAQEPDVFAPEDVELLYGIVQKMAETVERLQHTLRGEQEKMQSMVASMAEGAVMFDVHGDLTVLNPKARSMLGLSPSEEFTAQTFLRSIVWKDIAAFMAQPTSDGSVEQEFTVEAEPEPKTLYVAVTPVTNRREESLGRLAVIRDVTRERELDRMKADFVAVVSHELRTPLASIKMFISNLIDGIEGDITDGQRETLERVKKNVDRLSRLINDLLDLSKLEAGKMKIQPAPVDLHAALDNIACAFRPVAEDGSIDLRLTLPDHLPVLWADPDRLDQVLTNLVSNALKFTPEDGSVTIDVQRKTDPKTSTCDDNGYTPLSGEGRLVVAIKDTGAGIPEDDIDQVFDKFYQTDHSMTRKTGGTGLGLPICREIIVKHGGRIWAESVLNEGATFTFELPVDARAHDRQQLQAALEREIPRAQRYGTPFAALMLDVDNFTDLNAEHGYACGDAALVEFQDMIREEVRQFLQERVRETDVVGRFGGDEFLVIAAETDEDGGRLFAERLRALIEAHEFTNDEQTIHVTVSIGVTAFCEEDSAPATVVGRAIRALADAKRNGKNAVC